MPPLKIMGMKTTQLKKLRRRYCGRESTYPMVVVSSTPSTVPMTVTSTEMNRAWAMVPRSFHRKV